MKKNKIEAAVEFLKSTFVWFAKFLFFPMNIGMEICTAVFLLPTFKEMWKDWIKRATKSEGTKESLRCWADGVGICLLFLISAAIGLILSFVVLCVLVFAICVMRKYPFVPLLLALISVFPASIIYGTKILKMFDDCEDEDDDKDE